MNSYANAHRKSSTYQRFAGANSLSLVTGLLPFTSEMALFEFPFNELLVSFNCENLLQPEAGTALPHSHTRTHMQICHITSGWYSILVNHFPIRFGLY